MTLIHLSDHFYDTFASATEILHKRSRPYACLAIRIDGIVYAIPFRHRITHKYAFFTGNRMGLDFTKAVVVRDSSFIGNTNVQIEQAEFNAIKGQERRIAAGMRNFITVYKKALRYPENKHYDFIRRCSSLQYFSEHIK